MDPTRGIRGLHDLDDRRQQSKTFDDEVRLKCVVTQHPRAL
jgi:hypothetical protein